MNRTFTSRDQLGEVNYDSAMVSQFTYDPGMRETSRTLGNGLDTRHVYGRNDNMVTQIVDETTSGGADRPDASFAYTYDANKNPTSETTGTGSDAMSDYSYTASYDAKDRLTNWARANSIDSQLWSLTHVGDWSSTTINGTMQTRTHNAVHELTGISGNNLAYDPKGDITRMAGDSVDRFKWDFDNKMSSADVNQDGTDDLAFTYDALGRRVSKDDLATGTNTVYVCAGQQVVTEYAANDDPATSAPQEVYVYGSYIDEPLMKVDAANGKLYYHRNRQYCITAMTDASGNVVERYVYTAYGVTTILAPDGTTVRATSAVGNSYMYTGRRLDKEFASSSEGAIYYYRARYYVPQLGRFIGRDPMGYVDGFSLYQYVGSSPVGAMDAWGLSWYNPGSWGWVQATGHGIVAGTEAVGHGLAVAGRATGHAIVTGTEAAGHVIAVGGRAVGHGFMVGARAVGHAAGTVALSAMQPIANAYFHKLCHCKQIKEGDFYGENLGVSATAAYIRAVIGQAGLQAVVECGAHAVAFYAYYGGGTGWGFGDEAVAADIGIVFGHGVYAPTGYNGYNGLFNTHNVVSGGFNSPTGWGVQANGGSFSNSTGNVAGYFGNIGPQFGIPGFGGSVTSGSQHYTYIGALQVP